MTTVKDPLYREIEKRLSERLDPVVFERCAVELLRRVYPGLVPVSGGGDAGMDGVISEPTGGPPVPLVCTTARDVIGNLTKNLESYLKSGGRSREAVLAMSQALTARKRRNLEERAQEMGFELRNVHDRDDFTGRLYREPTWRKALLGLAGDLPALSVYPRLYRPGVRYGADRALVGRDEAASWVLSQRDDFVLVGQPGVGKRSLLRLLAEEGRGLFVVTNDMARIADDYRAEQPEFLLLEDAHLLGVDLHLRSDLLSAICRRRWEIEASFKIAATTWTWPDRRVADAIGPTVAAKTIHPLTRPDTAKVVRSIAPRLPEAAVAKSLDQSEGRPGLAVTLAERAGARNAESRLHDGQQLLEYLRGACTSRLTDRDLDVLGAFALSGSAGAALARVANALGESEASLRATLSKIAHTGIVKDRGHYLAIVNPALRAALVARTFFQGPSSLAVCEHLAVMPDRHSATKTLIDALARGASVPQELIQSRLPQDATDPADQELWQCYAGTAKAAVRWIVHEHSRKIPSIAYQALRILPATTLSKLISVISASQEDGEPDRQEYTPSSQRSVDVLDSWGTDPAITAIEDWIREPTRHTVRRRRLLLDALSSSFAGLHQASRGLRQATAALVPFVFSLDLRRLRLDPIELGTIWLDIRRELLPEHIEQIHALWKPSIDLLRKAHAVDTARGIARSWATAPLRSGNGLPPETARIVQDLAAGMITDVVRWSDRRPGVVLWAKQIAAECDLHVAGLPESPSDLKKLFGIEPDDLTQGRQDRAIRLMAEKLASQPAAVGVDQLLRYQDEARVMLYKQTALGTVEKIPHHMAEHTEDPSACVVVLVSRQAPVHWVAPFVDAMLARGHGCEEGWRALLARDEYSPIVLQCVICRSEVPETVETSVLERLADSRTLLDIVNWRDVPNAWKERILTHENRQVAGTAACEMYRQYRDHDPELSTLSRMARTAWCRAIVESDDEAALASVFERHPNAAKAWLLSPGRHLSTKPNEIPKGDIVEQVLDGLRQPETTGSPMLYATAVSALDPDAKLQLIRAMSANTDSRALTELVGNDATLYDALLSRRDLKQIHLKPLENGMPSPDLAEVAVNHGYSPEDVAKRIASWAESHSMFVDFPEFRTVEEMRNPGEEWFPEPPEDARHKTMAEWERHSNPVVRQIYGLVMEMET